MKKFQFFNIKLIFGIEKKTANKKNRALTSAEFLNHKIMYLILIVGVILMSSKTQFTTNNNLKYGKIAQKDILAPQNIIFNDTLAKENVILKILNNTPKQYTTVYHVEEEAVKNINYFFTQLEDSKNKNINISSAYKLINKNLNKKISLETFQYLSSKNKKETEKLKLKYIKDIQLIYKNGVINDNNKLINKNLNKKISLKTFQYLSSKNKKETEKLKSKYIKDIQLIYKNGVINDNNKLIINNSINIFKNIDSYEKNFLNLFITPNYVFNIEATKKVLNEKIDQIKNIVVKINAGSIIVKKGSIISKRDVLILKKANLYGDRDSIISIITTFLYFILISIVFKNICTKFLSKELLTKSYYRAIMLSMVIGILSYRLVNSNWKYILPIETIFLILGILINIRASLIIGGFILLFSKPLNSFSLDDLVIEIISLLVSVYLITRIKNRTNIINTGIYIGLTKVCIMFIFALNTHLDVIDSIIKSSMLFLSGAFSGMLTIALLPYFERTFNILTNIKLLELGDLSQPLLRKLAVSAPGTFQHSMMVATLAEQATENIGGNHLFARIASYYHDIGKMKRPQFYVENQTKDLNLHDKLTPNMSTLIITSHTKDGDEIGKKYNLPKELRDIMYEHQGTTLLAYFYNKAKQTNKNINENDFRYSGPKPRSKESAVIMLADSIEAAVRSIDEKTPVAIEKMLRKIIGVKIEEEQLSDADLTFKEIEVIIQSFTKILMSIHHVRLKYPDKK